ncbi:MAG: family 43 glycosylhydrolase, partial [Bacteroidaceae bacterium]|nr:family 43 glycosylhydrolase [Bacteroidaceae bacterium]
MKLKSALLLSAFAMTTANAVAQNQNPIINSMYSADPSARVFGDTLWVYPSHDKDDALSFSMEDYHTFSTTDMKTWTDHGVIFNPTKQTKWAKEAAWAPDCICRNGKYYLYYPTDKKHIGVAVSDRPDGPFRDPLGHPLISIDSPGVVCDRDFIDPCVFIDDDGQAYLFMGQNTVCSIKLNEDMISYDGKVHIIEGVKDFFEAVWVHKRNGIYYMSYSDGPFHGHEPQIAYCTSKSPLGPYTYQGVILDPVNSGTNHHSIVNYKGEDYLFYHTADISKYLHDGFHCGVRRSVCYDKLNYNSDGTICKVSPTLNAERVHLNGVSGKRQQELIAASISTPKI